MEIYQALQWCKKAAYTTQNIVSESTMNLPLLYDFLSTTLFLTPGVGLELEFSIASDMWVYPSPYFIINNKLTQ